jgi:hypothetical protein
LNIVGGLLASGVFIGITNLIRWLKQRFQKSGYRKVFGEDSVSDFNIVYGKMDLPKSFDQNGNCVEFPLEKKGTGYRFIASSPVSSTCMKSARYLSESFLKNAKYAPKLISDDEIKEKVDISYCSVGGYNNFKTIDIFESEKNKYYEFSKDCKSIVDKENVDRKYESDGKFDYAIILKIKPKSFSNRVWIAVAGLGEWGTTGASWYLARNWKKIRKMAKNKEFGFVVKVEGGKDESADIVDRKIGNC